MKALLLMSGGLDSSSAAYYYTKKGLDFDCLFVDYGQKSARMQLKSSSIICGKLNKKLLVANIKKLRNLFISSEDWLKPHEPIVHRNVIIIPIAIAFAKEKGYQEIIIASVKEDCEYEQNRYEIMNELKRLGEILGVKVSTPFAGMPKSFLLKIGVSSGLDPSLTYSCLLGHKYHCGQCSQCTKRKEAFKAANLPDPTKYLKFS
ncbi:7-cyano-7-deazaguanine synthase [Sulfurisphaera javensis]|uniref:7-cyano-7-deazaguanine synthase n=1 Tax=Sulfurisphaera javensis TaxID=2049879 RepID=A0AAT9GNC9_9CREN